LKSVGQRPKGLVNTVTINWLIKPFTMAALGVLFFQHLFAGLIEGDKASEYIAGLILLGAAPCTAMVFVWSQMTKGDANYTLVQVSLNDLIMVFAFAPIVAFLLGVTDITARKVPNVRSPMSGSMARKPPSISGICAHSSMPSALCAAQPFRARSNSSPLVSSWRSSRASH
jgi:ACR3 family arsenite efflux pump ArsB